VKPSLQIDNSQTCPMCGGVGKAEPTVQIADRIEKQLIEILEEETKKSITLIVHPFLYSYFSNGFLSKKSLWMLKYKKWINIKQDFSLGLIDYKIC
jgi:ribonuclease G